MAREHDDRYRRGTHDNTDTKQNKIRSAEGLKFQRPQWQKSYQYIFYDACEDPIYASSGQLLYRTCTGGGTGWRAEEK